MRSLAERANQFFQCVSLATIAKRLRRPESSVFSQLVEDALAYSKRNKRSYKTDVRRFASLKDWFGSHPAEELTPREIETVLARAAEKGSGRLRRLIIIAR